MCQMMWDAKRPDRSHSVRRTPYFMNRGIGGNPYRGG